MHLLTGFLYGRLGRHVGRGRKGGVKHLVGGGGTAVVRRQVGVRLVDGEKRNQALLRHSQQGFFPHRSLLAASYHVGHVVEPRVLPVGCAVVGEQPIPVGIRETPRTWLGLPTPWRAPSSGHTRTDDKKNLRIAMLQFTRSDHRLAIIT